MTEFDDVLLEATRALEEPYFQLPVAGLDSPIYRERVYCYELYHQLRSIWPANAPYSLAGEIDKIGHPFIRGGNLNRTKPDLLVHKPREMRSNYAVIEVKPGTASVAGLRKDLRTLTAFRNSAGYERALLLVYGPYPVPVLLARLMAIADQHAGPIDLTLIEVWMHQAAGESAARVHPLT